MTLDFLISLFRFVRSCGRADVSTMVVVTFSGVPILGGMVIWGRTGWILFVTKTSFTKLVMRLDFPVPSSPHKHMRTTAHVSGSIASWSNLPHGGDLDHFTCGHGSTL